MQLIVAEKPSVARDLARVLGIPTRGGAGCFESERTVITWCVGHLVELDEPAAYDPAWKAWRLDTLPMIPAELTVRPAKHAKDQLRVVKALLRDRRFTSVINACDAGREGELIFRYVYQYARATLPVQRLWVSSLTDDALRRGFAALRPGRELEPLADAARCRSEADWLVGLNATRAITVRGRLAGPGDGGALYSIGRVQTPTLAMLVEREREIAAFVPVPYWQVHAALRDTAGATFVARWVAPAAASAPAAGRLARAELADAIVARDTARGAAAHAEGPRVERVDAKTTREPPPLLFDLTSLQRTANRRFGFSAARTLELAQALYERHKVVTYPRTDSRHLSSDVGKELPEVFAALAGVAAYAPFADVLVAAPPRPGRRVVDDAKVSDHHAIIPTANLARAGALDRDEQRVFDLIARRFLGAFFPDAEIAITEVWIRVGPAGPTGAMPARPPAPAGPRDEAAAAPPIAELPALPDRYVARGRVRLVAGWQDVAGIAPERTRKDEGRGDDGDDEGHDEARALPVLAPGQALSGSFRSVAKHTTPPPRYSEATLLGAMEAAGKQIDDETLRAAMKDRGLGTPATRAAIIETLLRRGYVERTKQHLVATPFGIGLVQALPVASLASPELTGAWEARLADIARGKDSRAAFMADIARYVTELVDAIRAAPPPAAPAGGVPDQPRGWFGSARRSGGRGGARTGGRGRARPSGNSAPRPAGNSAPRPAGNSPPRPAGGVTSRATTDSPPRSRAAAVGELACPRCRQGHLITGSRGWGCSRWSQGCGLVVWFEIAGKRVTAAQLRDLVTRGKTRVSTFRPDGEDRAGHLVLDVAADRGAARFVPR